MWPLKKCDKMRPANLPAEKIVESIAELTSTLKLDSRSVSISKVTARSDKH